MPNTFAYAMLWGWPVITVILFMRLPVPKAAAASLIAGYLLLPTQPYINFPLLPSYGRDLAAALPTLAMAMIMSRPAPAVGPHGGAPAIHMVKGWLPQSFLLKVCILMLVASPFLTSLTNGDPYVTPEKVLPALSLYDGASNVLNAGMALIPFMIARKWLASSRDHAVLLGFLCLAGLAYSVLALYEIRMSPQLNRMVYGFFPHSWIQHMRGDGFRPLVFLEHGLRLGIFMAVAVLAAVGYSRARNGGNRGVVLLAGLWLFGTLVLCKSVGALILATVLAPVILFLGARTQILVAAVFAAIVLVYPMTRSSGLLPTDTVSSTLSTVVSSGRIASLNFRFRNEDVLLEHANRKPLFGWGAWGRNMVYDEKGRNITITDGTWVIIFGKDGWFGYLATFGLLTLPVMLLAIRRRDDLTLASSALSVALVANLIDLIPNSGLTPLTWLMAGAIAGRLELGRVDNTSPETEAAPVQASPYRRSFPDGAATPRGATLRRSSSEGRGYQRARSNRA